MPSSALPGNALLLSRGYGYVPKAVMQDRRISISAKALYAYLGSFCGRGGQAFPSVEKMMYDLNVGKQAYYSAMKQLKDSGYVAMEQVKDKGRFARCVYTLPGESAGKGEGPAEEKPHAVKPFPARPHTDGRQAGEPEPGNSPANNNILNNTNLNNNPMDEDDSSASPGARMGERACESVGAEGGRIAALTERKRIVALMVEKQKEIIERNRAYKKECRPQIEACFKNSYSREALGAEAEQLTGLLVSCDADALLAVIRKSALYNPASPARYIARIVDKYQRDAFMQGFTRFPRAKLTIAVLSMVDERNDAEAIDKIPY